MWELIEIIGNTENVINTFDTHKKAKNALYWAKRQANEDWLDIDYKIIKI